MNLTSSGRRAEAFAALLDSGARTDDPVVGPFAALAQALSTVPAVTGPRPEFRTALRQRLVAVAAVQGVGEPASASARLRESATTWRFQRRIAVLAGGAAAATAIAGVGLGASRSLPGDPFYGLKRATEDVQLATTFGQEAKGRRHLEFARTRLGEVEALAGTSAALGRLVPGHANAVAAVADEALASTIVATLQDMDAETREGARDLVAAFRDSGDRAPLETLDRFTQDQFRDLRAVLPALPQDARARATGSLALLDGIAENTVRLAGRSTPGPADSPSPSPSATGPTSRTTSSPRPEKTTTPGDGGATQSPEAGGTSTPDPGTTLPGVPTTVPTIPPILPTLTPPASILPTSILPTSLPDLPSLG